LPVDQLRLPHPDKSGFVITENVSPSPYPLPSRARNIEKISPQKGGNIGRIFTRKGRDIGKYFLKRKGILDDSPIKGGESVRRIFPQGRRDIEKISL